MTDTFNSEILLTLQLTDSTSSMHKGWHYTSAVKVGHFEWLTMYTGVISQQLAKPVSLKQAMIPNSNHLSCLMN